MSGPRIDRQAGKLVGGVLSVYTSMRAFRGFVQTQFCLPPPAPVARALMDNLCRHLHPDHHHPLSYYTHLAWSILTSAQSLMRHPCSGYACLFGGCSSFDLLLAFSRIYVTGLMKGADRTATCLWICCCCPSISVTELHLHRHYSFACRSRSWNLAVFGGRLPPDLPLVWNPRLVATAGQVLDDGSLNSMKTAKDQ
eukprot:1158128-Pelagomonas_calceolata.AAC.1